ncbi:MAG: DUF4394 domain-containing protein [Burkholderiales bacterium]|nr:DUF4394 domain-containing protein [Opitutaceae bacterium]
MKSSSQTARLSRSLGLVALLATAATAQAQTAFGVDATGALFSFNLSSPGTVNSIGPLGFTPEAIDFRPGTSTLYAFDVTGTTARLYTVNTSTGAATPISAGFATSGVAPGTYDFSDASSYAFDFNPTTQQALPDTSIRIRLVGNDGTNLRLHSGTGGIAAVDGSINGVSGATVTGAAYTRSDFASVGAVPTGTALYYIDSANNSLLTTAGLGPNSGTVTPVGALGTDIGIDIGFDILTGGSTNTAYLVDTTGANIASFYTVNLTTGTATSLGTIARDFTGGFAIDQLSAIPEPSSFAALAGALGLGFAATRRRRAA